jgi:hypothetical protein
LLAQAGAVVEPDHDPGVGDELAAWEGHIRLLEVLDGIRMRKAALAAESPDGVWHAAGIRSDYQAAFREAGYDPSGLRTPGEVADLVRRLSASPIRDELVAALDDWAWGARGDDVDAVWAVTARATGDNWRASLRVTSVSAPEALRLTRDVPVDRMTPALVCGLGLTQRLILAGDRRRAVRWMEAGARAYPADFWVAFYLGIEYMRLGEHESAAGAFRAAVAVRPDAELARRCLDRSLAKARSAWVAPAAGHTPGAASGPDGGER